MPTLAIFGRFLKFLSPLQAIKHEVDLDELHILKITFKNGLGKSCGKFLWENLAGNACRKILWEIL